MGSGFRGGACICAGIASSHRAPDPEPGIVNPAPWPWGCTVHRGGPLGPLGCISPNIAQRHALHVERTAEKAFMLSDRV